MAMASEAGAWILRVTRNYVTNVHLLIKEKPSGLRDALENSNVHVNKRSIFTTIHKTTTSS